MRQSGSPAERPFYWLALAVLVVFVLWVASDILVPIALAVLIWFLVNALAKSIARVPGLANLPNRLIAALILTVILLLAGSILSQSIGELARDAAERQRTLLDRVTELASTLGLEDMLAPDRIREILRPEEWLGTVLATAQGFISNISLIFLYAVFLLVDERYYEAKIRALVPNEARRADLMETFASIGETTRLYLWLMTLISAGVGLITFAVCAGVGLGGAAFWGFMAFALNFVPTIGSILAVLLPALYALATLADPALLAVLVAALAATQFVAGEIVVPRLMGNRLNLSSFVILLSLIVFGAVWGPVGMFLAIPITVILVLIGAKFQATRPIAILLSKDGSLPEMRDQIRDAA